MAITFAELHDGGQFEVDLSAAPLKGRSATRRFIAPGYNETAALASAINAANGQLNVGAPHPRDGTLKLVSLSAVERVGADTESGWILRADYIPTDATVPDFPQDPDAIGVVTKSATLEVVSISYPLLARRYLLDPESGFTNLQYDKDVGAIDVSGARYTFQVNLGLSPDQTLATIAPRVNKIHRLPPFGSTDWLFLGAYVHQIKSDRWSYIYNWFTEPGNAPIIPEEFAQPGNPSAADLIYVPERAPHERYMVRYRDIGPDVTVSPSIEVIQPFQEDFSGWSALPGISFGGGIQAP